MLPGLFSLSLSYQDKFVKWVLYLEAYAFFDSYASHDYAVYERTCLQTEIGL